MCAAIRITEHGVTLAGGEGKLRSAPERTCTCKVPTRIAVGQANCQADCAGVRARDRGAPSAAKRPGGVCGLQRATRECGDTVTQRVKPATRQNICTALRLESGVPSGENRRLERGNTSLITQAPPCGATSVAHLPEQPPSSRHPPPLPPAPQPHAPPPMAQPRVQDSLCAPA